MVHSNLKCLSDNNKIVLKVVDDSVVITTPRHMLGRLSSKWPFYWIDPMFKKWSSDKYRTATETIEVAVYEVTDLTLGQIFDRPSSCTMSQRDVIEFCIEQSLWLGCDSILTKFLTKEDDKFFIITIGSFSFGRRVFSEPFNPEKVVAKKTRFVMPVI